MKLKAKFLTLFLIVCAIAILPLYSYGTVSKADTMRTLVISESHGLGGSHAIWRSSDDLMAKNINVAHQLGNLGLTQTTFTTASQALNAVNSRLTQNFGQDLNLFVRAMASFLISNGYNHGRFDWYFSFIDAGDNNEQKKIYLPLIIHSDGNIRNLGARIIASTPRILYYIYHSRGVEGGLPPEWSYPNGGILVRHVLDQNFSIISTTTTDTGGRFDPPVTPLEGDVVLNPNAGLELLIQEVAVPDMQNKNAIFSIVDYARRPEPVWDCDAQGNCVARVSVESTRRQFAPDVGGGCYSNAGRIGWTISFQVERYFVEPSGRHNLTAISTGASVAQPRDFAKTVPLGRTPDFWEIIDPFHTFNIYRFNNDTVNNLLCNNYVHGGWMCNQAPIQVRHLGGTPSLSGHMFWVGAHTVETRSSGSGIGAWFCGSAGGNTLSISGCTFETTCIWLDLPGVTHWNFMVQGAGDKLDFFRKTWGCVAGYMQPHNDDGQTLYSFVCTQEWIFWEFSGSIRVYGCTVSGTLKDGNNLYAPIFRGSGNQLVPWVAGWTGSGAITFTPTNIITCPVGNYFLQ